MYEILGHLLYSLLSGGLKMRIISRHNMLSWKRIHVHLGPVVQRVVSLTSSLRVISLTVLADSIHNILIFFAEKM